MTLLEGLRLGVVDGRSGKVVDTTTGRTLALDEAVKSAAFVSPEVGDGVTRDLATSSAAAAKNLPQQDIITGTAQRQVKPVAVLSWC